MSSTIDNLNKLVARLERKNEKLHTKIAKVEEERDDLQRQLESDTLGWATPQKWDENDLPLPRLELHWKRLDEHGYSLACDYMLVYAHLLDKCSGEDDRHVIAKPLGRTRSNGGRGRPPGAFIETRGQGKEAHERIDTPFRDSAHANSDAKHLKLPLFVTTEDGDVAEIIEHKQRIVRRAKASK